MKCPECGYTSFDHLEECRKCGAPLSPVPVFRYLYEDNPGVEELLAEQDAPAAEDFLSFEADLEDIPLPEEGEGSPPGGLVPATLGSRFSAFAVDFLFVLCTACAALFSAAYLIGETSFPGLGEFVSTWGSACLGVYVLSTAYFFFVPSLCGTTLGNYAAGIRVVKRDGSAAGAGTNLLRWAGWVVSVGAVFAGFAPAAFDPERKTLCDRLCGTLVVRT